MKRATIGAVAVLMVLATGCTDTKKVDLVKKAELTLCEGATIEQMATSFMDSPAWASGKEKDGMDIVKVSGDVPYRESKVKATLQFEINKSGSSFKFRSFKLNDVPQDELDTLALWRKMCESALESYLEYDRAAQVDIRNAKTSVIAYWADNGKYPERLEQAEYKASAGVRLDYKRINEAEFVLSAYHEKGAKIYSADGESSGVKEERR